MWCEQHKSKKSTLSHETKVLFRPLTIYHIFHNTDTYSLFSLYKRGGIESKPSKKKIWKKVGKKFSEKKFEEKNLKKKCWEKILEKKFWNKNCERKILGKNFFFKCWKKYFGKKVLKKKCWKNKLQNKNIHNQFYINIDKCHTIFSFDKTGRKTEKTSVVYDSK